MRNIEYKRIQRSLNFDGSDNVVDEPEDYASKINKLLQQAQPARDLIDRLKPSFLQDAVEKASAASTLFKQFEKFTQTQLPGVENSTAEYMKRFVHTGLYDQTASTSKLVSESSPKGFEAFANGIQFKDAFALANTVKMAFPPDLLQRASSEVELIKGVDKFKLPVGIAAEIFKWQVDKKSLIGPLDDLRTTGLLELAPSNSAFASAALALANYEQHFKLPDNSMLSPLIKSLDATKLLSRPFLDLAGRMTAPWLDTLNPTGSISAFAKLHNIGETLRIQPAFSDQTTALLRGQLGDWRDSFTIPELADSDILVRSDFYATRGLRRELTDFPPDAFFQIIRIGGVAEELPAPSELYGEPFEDLDGEESSAFARTNEAHRLLFVFEVRMRRCINRVMTEAFGPDWPKHQLPNGMYDKWVESQQKAEKAGRAKGRLIDYADFTHYVLIIQKKNLWPLFQSRGFNLDSVRESFNRLGWPRVEVSHGRAICQEDELLLYIEIKRLVRAFDL